MSGMRPLGSLISLDEALSICLEASRPTDLTDTAHTSDSLNRVLAEDILAEVDVPPFPRAAMDGYAVRYDDILSAGGDEPAVLEVVEKLFAGQVPSGSIGPGCCAEIATGAMLPEGADTVVMAEDTLSERVGSVKVLARPERGQHVIRPGDDIRRGEKVAEKGDLLTPGKIGALSAVGRERVRVYAEPRVVIMPTGDEIARPGTRLEPGQIYDVNTFSLRAAVEDFGGEAIVKPVVDDTEENLTAALKGIEEADIVVLSGGSSVGERDLIAEVLEGMGELLFHGVAIKPGKPTILGRIGELLVMGMPGHPTSCLSNAYIFLEPMIRRIGRYPEREGRVVRKRLAREIRKSGGRVHVMTVKLEGEMAVPVYKESSAITSMAHADGYLLIPEGERHIEEGEEVTVFLFK